MKLKNYAFIKFLLIIILFLSGLFILIFKPSKPIITSKITKDTSSLVYLFANPFYAENPYSSNLYASNSIKNIYLKFNYHLTTTSTLPTMYKYKLTTEIIATIPQDNTNPIWTKTYFYAENSEKILKPNELNLTKDLNIDYSYYNNLVTDYEETYNLKVEAILKVKLNLQLSNFNNQEFSDDIEIDIPLNSKTTSINKVYEPTTIKTKTPNNYFKYVGLTLILTSFVILSSNLKTKINFKSYRLNRILKEYAEYIITVNEAPPLNNLIEIPLNKLEDLITLALTNHTHIISYKKNSQTYLYCFVNNYVYIYTLLTT